MSAPAYDETLTFAANFERMRLYWGWQFLAARALVAADAFRDFGAAVIGSVPVPEEGS